MCFNGLEKPQHLFLWTGVPTTCILMDLSSHNMLATTAVLMDSRSHIMCFNGFK